MSILKSIVLFVGLFFWMVFSSISWADNNDLGREQQGFSASVVEYNRHHSDLQKESFIQMSQQGMRMVHMDLHSGQPNFMVIQNFRSQQKWLVRPDRLYYVQWPEKEDELEERKQSLDFSKGVLSNQPCLGMKKKRLRVYDFEGGELEVWSCFEKGKEVFVQHYSTLLGMVIRQEAHDGHIFELRNIVLNPPEENVFTPSHLWREVSVEEFFVGTPVLPNYRE